MHRLTALFLGTLFILLATAVPARSQSAKASLTGRVLDQNQASINGAQVTLSIKDAKKQRTFVTQTDGSFRFDELPPGEYQLSAVARGFSVIDKAIVLKSGDTGSVDLTLQPSSLAETVVVSSSYLLGNAEVVERTPGAVDVIDKRTLESSRVLSSSEALRKVSGLNVRDEEGFGLRPNIGIRGLNPTRSTKVLLLEDGLPLAYAPYGDNASYYHPPVERFERIEVLKGSGQVLFGPQTIGGVINYITPRPADELAGAISLHGGNRGYGELHAQIGDTLDSTRYSVGLTRKATDGVRDNMHFTVSDLNLKVVHDFDEKHALTVRASYYDENS